MGDHKLKTPTLSELQQTDQMIRATSVILLRVRVDIKKSLPIEFISKNISVYGYSAQQIMSSGMGYTDLMHPDDIVPCGELLFAFLREGKQEYMLEYRIVTADNQVRWVEDRLLIEWDEESGRATHIQGLLLDITERKEAETALADSLARAEAQTRRLQALNRLSQDLMQVSDEQALFAVLRQHTTDIVEADRVSLTLASEDETMLDIIELDLDNASQRAIIGTQIPIEGTMAGDAYREKKPVIITDNITFERLSQIGIQSCLCVPIIFGDQVMGTINIGRFNPDQYDDGEVQLLVQIASLIASILANQQLVDQMRRTHEVIAQSSSVLFQWKPEPEFPVLFVTDNVRQFGYTAEQLISGEIPFLNILHADDVECTDQEINNYIAQGINRFVQQYRIITSDGDVRWIDDRSTIIHDEQGHPTHIQGIILDITERKIAEKQLETANNIIQISPVILIRSQVRNDIDWPTLFISEGITQLGYMPADLVSSDVIFIRDIIHPEDADRVMKIVQDHLDAGANEYDIEYRVLTRDGEVRWINDLSTCERDKQGRPLYCQAMLVDITERKLAQNMLEITQYSIDSASNPIGWMAKDGRFVYANDALCQHFDYTKEQLLTMYFYDFHPEFTGDGWKQFWEKIKLEKVITSESVHLRRDGQEIPVEITNNYHKIGGHDYVFAFVQDITERKKAAEAIAASKKNLELILDKLPVPVCLVELATGQPIYVNEAYCQLHRGSQKDVLGRNSKHIYKNPKDRERLLLSRLEKDGFVWQQQVEFIRLDGTSFWGSISTHLIHEGKSTISTVFDLTERIKNEKELEAARDAAEAANKAKSEFLSNMSHELRTPLNGILGYTQLLQRDNTLLDGHKQSIGVIHQSGEYLLMLINSVLDIAKIEAQKLELHEMPTHTYSFLEGITNIVVLQLLEKEIEFVMDIAPDLPKGIMVDQVRLQQVLLNLLSNAKKFTRRGKITFRASLIELSEQTVHILFEVNDTGVGIRPEQLEQIFQAFEQVGDKDARSAGTGLGLAISQQLVQMMGGEIIVSSVVGQGSSFCFGLTFDLTSAVTAIQENPLEYRVGYKGERKTVLIVDDNQVNCSFLNELLTNRGFTIVEAENGREALKQLEIHAFDLIITDLVMPGMDGYELSRNVKEQPLTQHIPMIAVSASTEEQSGQSALDAGFDAFFPKPVFVPHLLDEIGIRLHLIWIYEKQKIVPRADETIDIDPTDLLCPTLAHLNALIEIVELGDMIGAATHVNQLAGEDKQLTAFCRYVGQLAADFEDEELLDFLKTKQ